MSIQARLGPQFGTTHARFQHPSKTLSMLRSSKVRNGGPIFADDAGPIKLLQPGLSMGRGRWQGRHLYKHGLARRAPALDHDGISTRSKNRADPYLMTTVQGPLKYPASHQPSIRRIHPSIYPSNPSIHPIVHDDRNPRVLD